MLFWTVQPGGLVGQVVVCVCFALVGRVIRRVVLDVWVLDVAK